MYIHKFSKKCENESCLKVKIKCGETVKEMLVRADACFPHNVLTNKLYKHSNKYRKNQWLLFLPFTEICSFFK